jgi:IS30 family transposase
MKFDREDWWIFNYLARDMGRNKSTISRELQRNKGKCGYRYQQAQIKAQQRHLDKVTRK